MAFHEIQPNAFYDLERIEAEVLDGKMTGRQFIEHFRPVKRTKSLWLGRDILDAILAAPAIGQHDAPETRGRKRAAEIEEIAIPARK